MPINLSVRQQIKQLFITLAIVCLIQIICSFLPDDLGLRLGLGTCVFGGLLILLQIIVLCLLVRQNSLGRDKHA
jgi:hypothetical protein